MKKRVLKHKAPNPGKRAAAFLLCCLLAVCFYAPPALGAQPEENAAVAAFPEEAASQPGESAVEPASSEPSEKALEEPTPAAQTPNEEPAASEQPEEPAASSYTLTFRMGSFGEVQATVQAGAYPTEIPAIPELPAAQILGWYDEAGNQVSPGSVPVQRDMTYTARWSRQTAQFLNTTDHFPYIQGYRNGMFKPSVGITRAEAAQLFFNLLQNKDVTVKTFTDTASSSLWYSKPVGVMATLGVLQGYKDGFFLPNRKITREEFVKMAVSCDTLENGKVPFSDVPAASWSAPYIATAASKGWINGYKDGTFRPGNTITRAEAVTILNKMLGRTPDAAVKNKTDVKNFYDVFPSNWAYSAIVEASTSHTYTHNGQSESWADYEKDTSVVEKSHWINDGSSCYYLDAKTRKFLRGFQTIDGQKYLFDSSTGAAYTGFRTEGSWQRYYKNGILQNDISGLGVVSGPYFIKVYKPSNYLIIFAKDSKGQYNIPVRAMRVSCGMGTPCGTFYTPDRYRWLKMIGDTYAQWCTQISGNYLFHSVPNWTYNNFDLEVDEYNHLGDTRSMGCIRLNCRDAKWIYDNCVLGTKVFISAVETSGPLTKPAGIQIPYWHTWDPTDPTAYWKCKQNGCH